MKQYQLAANKRHPQALHQLALMVMYDQPEKAIQLLKHSADQGDAQAQYNLANCLVDGQGFKQDVEAARNYYRYSAAQGHKDADQMLKLSNKTKPPINSESIYPDPVNEADNTKSKGATDNPQTI